jgi:hypothetical protein
MNRPLTDRERRVLDRLLQADGLPAADELRGQAAAATVTGYCGCGCPSIHLRIDRSRAKPATRRVGLRLRAEPITGRPLAEAEWEAGWGGLLLWSEDGWLDYLEVFWGTDAPPDELPAPEEVRPLPFKPENS